MNIVKIIIKPVLTEKTVKLADSGKYTFAVRPEATKAQVKKALFELYGAQVGKVRSVRGRVRRKKAWRSGKWVLSKSSTNSKKMIVEVSKNKDKIAKLFKL